jgi:hypothetical protein
MTARRKTARSRPTEADLRRPLEYREHYDNVTPGPVAGHNIRGVFLQVDSEGFVCGEVLDRELREGDPPHDVRQTDMLKLYAEKKARWEAARRLGVAIPLPEYGDPEFPEEPNQ